MEISYRADNMFLQIFGTFSKFTPATMKGTKKANFFVYYQLSHVQVHLIYVKSFCQAPAL